MMKKLKCYFFLLYRGTAILLGFFSVLVTCSDIFISDSKIECLVGSVPDPVISNYCYIMGTFTLPNKFLRLNQEEVRQISDKY